MKKYISLFLLTISMFLLASCQKEVIKEVQLPDTTVDVEVKLPDTVVDVEVQLPDVTVDYYLIGFQTNGGNEIANLKLKEGDALELPTPVKEGYIFAGWYTDKKLNNKFENTGKMPAESFWLYADWHIELSFESNGGSACETITARAGSIINELPTPENGSHIFQGWYLDEEFTQKLGLVMPKESAKVYARWQAIESSTVLDITDTIKINGTTPYTIEEVADGYKVTATSAKGTWDFFYFTLDFNVKDYSMFEIVLEGPEGVKYMTKLESGGVTATEVARVLSGKEEKIYWTVQPANLTATGGEKFIIFLNYNVSGANADNPEYIIIKSIKLYRSVDLNSEQEHALFFNTNGGNVIAPIFAKEGEALTMPANPTKAGYEFGGWYKDSELTEVVDFTKMPAGPTTIYAKWEETKALEIKFVTNGGSSVDPIHTTQGSNVGTLPTSTLEGKLFVGWYKDQMLTQKFTDETFTEDLTLYAGFINPETQLANPVSFISNWSENEGGTYVVENGTTLKITTTESKGQWSYVKTMINPVGAENNILKMVVTGTEGKSMIIKLRGVSGKDYEEKLTFDGTEQTLILVLPEAIKYDYQAIIFVDGGKTGSDAGVTELEIKDLGLYQVNIGIDLSNYELLEFDAVIGYWNSKDSSKGNEVMTNQSVYLTNSAKITKEQMPVGSIIIIADGWQYRPDGWTTENSNESERKAETKELIVVCDEAWWGDYIARSFNISKVGKPKLTEDDLANIGEVFKIYVPKN